MGFWGGAGAEGRLLGEGSLLFRRLGAPGNAWSKRGSPRPAAGAGGSAHSRLSCLLKSKRTGLLRLGAGNRAAPGPLFNPPLRVLFCLWKVLARGEGSALLGLLPAGQKCSLMAD